MSDDLTTGTAASGGGDSSAIDVRGEAAAVFAAQSGENVSDAPPSENPSDPSTPPDAAIRADEATEATEASTLARGPIPYDRHQAVLTNTRNKVRAEVEGEWKPKLERLSWAESLDQQRVNQAVSLMTSLEALSEDKEAALAFIARRLGITTDQLGKATQPAPEDTIPEPDIPLDDGTAVYSATQLQKVLEWHGRQMTKQIDSSYGLGDLRNRTMLADLKVQAHQQTRDLLTECRTNTTEWPLFEALEPEIKELMIKHADLSLDAAYRRAFNGPNGWKKAQADTQKAAEQDRASQLARKQAAADAINPATARAVTPRSDNDKSTREIAAEVFASSLS